MRALTALGGALAASLLAGCATVEPIAPHALAAEAHYAALGSSYAAGANIPPLAIDRPDRCGASAVSYIRILADSHDLRLSDTSCGGATTAHVTEAWAELPAQIEVVTPQTRLVTVTIGGNDLGYMSVMFAASCHAGVRREGGTDPQAAGCPPVSAPPEDAYQALEVNMVAMFRAIRARAPHARIILVQYVALVPNTPCAAAPILPQHAATAREIARKLAKTSERAAMIGGAEVLPIDELSLGQTACDPQPWSHGYHAGYDMQQGAPWHPSAAGHAAIARLLSAHLASR